MLSGVKCLMIFNYKLNTMFSEIPHLVEFHVQWGSMFGGAQYNSGGFNVQVSLISSKVQWSAVIRV